MLTTEGTEITEKYLSAATLKIPHRLRDFQGSGFRPFSTKNAKFRLKRADAPTMTKSMRIALDNLKFDQLMVVYPGEKRYTLAKGIGVVPLAELVSAK